MDNKGFMMAEVVVVSAIVLVFLAGLYASYNKIYSIYSSRVDYYDVTTLYKLGYYRDVLIEKEQTDEYNLNALIASLSEIGNSKKINLTNSNESIYLINFKKEMFGEKVLDEEEKENQTFKDYVNFLSDSVEFNSNYVMVMESCSTTDKCKYAYLEVYDGKEQTE